MAGARRGRGERGVHRRACCGRWPTRDPASDGLDLALFVIRAVRSTRIPSWPRAFPTVVCPVSRPARRRAADRGRAHWLAAPGPPPRRRPRAPRRRHDPACCARRRRVVTIHDLQPLAHARQLQRGSSGATCAAACRRRSKHAPAHRVAVRATHDGRSSSILDVPPDRMVGRAARLHRPSAGGRAAGRSSAPTLPARSAVLPVPGDHLPPQEPRDAGAGVRRRAPKRIPTRCSCSPAAPARPGGACVDASPALGVARPRAPARPRAARRPRLRCTADATALTFPSRYEGFGMPVLEAMARGCPVIAADATALPEVVGDAGVLRRPRRRRRLGRRDGSSWRPTRDRRRELAVGGPRPRATAFTWASSARRRCRSLSAPPAAAARLDAVNLLVALPALRARRRADRRGDDQHRRSSWSPAATGCTSSRAAVVPAPPHRGGVGRQLVRTRTTDWGRITRVHPFPTDKRNIPARAAGLRRVHGAGRARRRACRDRAPTSCSPCRRRSRSGLAGWAVARARRVPFVFNIQDVFPDVAVELGRASPTRR